MPLLLARMEFCTQRPTPRPPASTARTSSILRNIANNGQLSQLEQELLWEFAKLSDKVKRAANLAKLTAESPNESLLTELRTLEKRMGLVLTLISEESNKGPGGQTSLSPCPFRARSTKALGSAHRQGG
ncbi:hypothetical protein L804_02129 [Cryptococcus deuterogattii 2001/935-1]|nr:hypothetical protein L804_02129 [Cryptococcus deuterogattii 2001/935-1]